jgi:ADP-heptose:LPS heptosyltransferase
MDGVKPANILVVHQGGIGDFILCLPAIGSIRRHYRPARMELMGYPRILQLVEGRYYVDKGKSIDELGLGSLYLGGGNLDGPGFRYFAGFDLAFLFTQDREGIFPANVRRAGVKEVFSIPPFPGNKRRVHVIDHLVSCLSSVGIPQGRGVPRIFLSRGDRRFAEQWLAQKGAYEAVEKGFIALHPGSGSRKKLWPVEKFSDLAARITGDLGLHVIVFIGPAEREYLGSGFELMRSMHAVVADNLPLIQVASLLDRCRCYIGNDSGMTHLAAAVGVPTVALFGPTDPEIWGPRGERVAIVRKELDCSPCTREDLERCAHGRCLELIEVEEVIERAMGLVNGGVFTSRSDAFKGSSH